MASDVVKLSNRDTVDLLKRIILSAPTDPDTWKITMDELIERTARDTDNWLAVFNCMGGVLTGVLLSIAEHEGMNIATVVGDLFNEEYAAMLDYDNEIESLHNAANTTDTSEGTDFVDRVLGDREVDGLGDGQ